MVDMSTLLATMDASRKVAYYADCATIMLANYDLDAVKPHFVQHNAGIVFRLEDAQGTPQFLLKIHESAGDGMADTPAQLAAQMAWLQALTDDGRVIVQAPIANRQGELVTQVQLPGLDRLSAACCQRWITANHLPQWEEAHAQAVGRLLATLHTISQEWSGSADPQFGTYEDGDLATAIADLAVMVELHAIDAEQYGLIQRTGTQIATLLATYPQTQATFGLVHGDLHQGNVLFTGTTALALDYGAFRSFYLYDLGVSLYHASSGDVAIRNALVAGYSTVCPLAPEDHNKLEAFMIMAALFNLAFQATLQEHRLSVINRCNLIQLVEKFCRPFVAGDPFLFTGQPLTIQL